MDNGIWATWYDIDASSEQKVLTWTHDTYIPFLKGIPGIAWVAHYRNSGGGPAMEEYEKIVTRTTENIGAGRQFVLLVGAISPHSFFKPYIGDVAEPEEHRTMLALRREQRSAIFMQEARVDGPAGRLRLPGSTPAPCIQFGTYRVKTVEHEFNLGRWYAQYRFPHMSQLPGCVQTRKLACIAGWVKHGIIYEFESLEARLEHFERPHEALALDPNEWTGQIFRGTIHSPGSPIIGERIWPPIER